MLIPTDRVIAKTLAKVIGVYGVLTGLPKDLNTKLLVASLKSIAKDNVELHANTLSIIMEAVQELKAEADGLASSTVSSPVPQPWEEDAGSGDTYYDGYDNGRIEGFNRS